MKKSPKKIDPSILLAFHQLLLAIQKGQAVFLLSSDDKHAGCAMSTYLDDLEGDMMPDKNYKKKVRAIRKQFLEQRTWGTTFGMRTPYPQELAKSRRFLRKLVAEIQDEKQGGEI